MRASDKLVILKKVNLLLEERRLQSLGESSNDTYFDTLSAALDMVRANVNSFGYEVDEDDMFTHFGTGGVGYDTSKGANIRLLKNGEPMLDRFGRELNRAVHVSIYRMPSGKYELTMYKTF